MVILANALFGFFDLNLECGELSFRFNVKVIGFFVAVVELLLKRKASKRLCERVEKALLKYYPFEYKVLLQSLTQLEEASDENNEHLL